SWLRQIRYRCRNHHLHSHPVRRRVRGRRRLECERKWRVPARNQRPVNPSESWPTPGQLPEHQPQIQNRVSHEEKPGFFLPATEPYFPTPCMAALTLIFPSATLPNIL